MKKRFNIFEMMQFKKALKEKLAPFSPLTYKYKFVKVFNQELYFVGNIRNVKKVFLIPMNTKRGYIWPTQKYFPFNVIKDGRVNVISRFIPALLTYFALIIALLFSTLVIPYNEVALLFIMYLIIAIIAPIAFKGVGAKNNAASQDASFRFAFEMLEEMDSLQRNQIGFIFMDTSMRQTGMSAMNAFFKEHNKAPLVIEPVFFSHGQHLAIASNRFESKYATSFAKKHQLKYSALQSIQEYYNYQKYLMVSYGDVDKDQDIIVSFDFKNKETLDEQQYNTMKQVLLALGSE